MADVATSTTGLLDTPEFARLLHDAHRHPLLRRELRDEHVPVGWDADEVWHALMAIREAQGFFTPYLVLTDTHRVEWLTVPSSMQATIARIGSLTQHGSDLDVLVGEYQGRRFFTQSYIDEVLTNLRLDGFPADHEAIRAVLLGDREPMGAAETVTRNFHALMNELGDYAARPIDPGLIGELYDRLNANVGACAAPLLPPTYPVINYHGDFGMGAEPSLERLLEVETQLAGGLLTEPEMHPILLSMLVNCFFWRFSPYPRFNNFMGCTVSRLFLYQHGYPAFRYVPKAWLYTEWRAGNMGHLLPYAFDEAVAPGNGTDDYTVLYDSIMKLMLHSVESTIADLMRRKVGDADALAAIDALSDLNPRQVEVLKEAVVRPDSEFTIRGHRKRFDVVYSTARKDLTHLADLGLLALSYKASTYVYRPVPELRRLLAEGRPATRRR